MKNDNYPKFLSKVVQNYMKVEKKKGIVNSTIPHNFFLKRKII